MTKQERIYQIVKSRGRRGVSLFGMCQELGLDPTEQHNKTNVRAHLQKLREKGFVKLNGIGLWVAC